MQISNLEHLQIANLEEVNGGSGFGRIDLGHGLGKKIGYGNLGYWGGFGGYGFPASRFQSSKRSVGVDVDTIVKQYQDVDNAVALHSAGSPNTIQKADVDTTIVIS